MRALCAALAGALFAAGLTLGGMTEPARIIAFLDVAGDWDPALAFVMAGAVLVYAPLFHLITTRMDKPLLDPSFHVPPRGQLDGKLFAGAALFGVGWGLAGFCPGPALVALGAGKLEAALFVLAMLLGMLAARWLEASRQARASRRHHALAADDA